MRLNLWLKHNLQSVHFKSVNSFLLAEDGWLSARGLKLSEAWFKFYQRGSKGPAIWSIFIGFVLTSWVNLVDCLGSWIYGTSGRGHSAKSTDGGWHRTEGHYGTKIQIFTRRAIIWEQIQGTEQPGYHHHRLNWLIKIILGQSRLSCGSHMCGHGICWHFVPMFDTSL